ncbi:hypothetical protein [Variovorax gossypii]|uniref:hypothetical protein n=1 Tax=uncultured Variovorax sp. TaxID=114708 RepID=UPI002609EB0F|nr:hypothetical protein [uncultured Variovorax sp.]
MSDNRNLFAPATSLLRMPSWLGPAVHEERELPFEPDAYTITAGERWTVSVSLTGETVYNGIGPVTVAAVPTRA